MSPVVARNGDENLDVALTVSSSTNHCNEWILDLGCSYYMSSIRDCFLSFEEFNSGIVLMGNENACKTKWIGHIRLKMFDETIRVLTYVRYVEEKSYLSRNLRLKRL